MEQLLFWLWGGIAVIFAVMMIFKRNPVHSALCLVVVMVSLALLYAMLGAEFLAAIQVIVYAGAVMVLFLFVIMLLNLDAEIKSQGRPRTAYTTCSMVGTGLLLILLLGGGAVKALRAAAPEQVPGMPGTTQAVAELLFTRYLLPFEVTSILLLAAIVGALVLAGKRE